MAIDRRQFVGLGLGALLFGPALLRASGGPPRLLSCRSSDQGEYFLSMLDGQGRLVSDIALPARGHGIAVNPGQHQAAVFARRPGGFVWILDLHSGEVTHRISAAPGRHYYGHGLFTADGAWLLCSENAFASGDGVIGVYDAADGYRRSGEFPSYGIGPHEIRLLNDGATLVVANGGIRTHPDLPRIKTNLATMHSNLAYIDLASHRLLRKYQPESRWQQLSIRHIDLSPDNRIAVAMQFEGTPQLLPPLIAIQQGEQPMQMLTAPDPVQRRLHNYCGSVAFSADGAQFAVSSPRGGVVTIWSADGEFLGLHEQSDACGIGQSSDGRRGFLVSDGSGAMVKLDARLAASERHSYPGCRWDNHLLTLSPRQGS